MHAEAAASALAAGGAVWRLTPEVRVAACSCAPYGGASLLAGWGARAQVTQKDGFPSMHGSGLGVLEGFMGAGVPEGSDEHSWTTFCPAGTRVDGYQVLQGPLLYQIRPRCSCYNCGGPPPPGGRARRLLGRLLCV